MFIAIIVPVMKKSKACLIVTLMAIVISCCLYYIPLFDGISSGFAIIICAVAASTAGALIFPEKGENQDE
jgi:predicted branched-subunit amino acid permease